MDPMEARLKCMELAVSASNVRRAAQPQAVPETYEQIKSAATLFSEFVIGQKPIESASQRPKGRDEK